MDTEFQRKKYQQHAIKIELPTQRHVFSVMLHWNHMDNKLTDLPCWHQHTRYEVQCRWTPDDADKAGTFRIVPPYLWHEGGLARDGEKSFMTAFQFQVKDRAVRNDEDPYPLNHALETFLLVEKPVEVADTFHGMQRMREIAEELEKGEDACYGVIYALFQLLLISLARSLPFYVPEKQSSCRYTAEDFRPEVIEAFLIDRHGDPTCSLEQLAGVLCVSERQAMRIVDQLYHMPFRELLTDCRMEFAESWRIRKKLSAEENARMVGYRSTRGFLEAYRQYHGREYLEIM